MFTLNPNAQIFPRALNTQIGGDADAIYLIVSDLGTPSGKGMDFVNGYTFLYVFMYPLTVDLVTWRLFHRQRFYTVYDTGKQQVGIAKTAVCIPIAFVARLRVVNHDSSSSLML